MYRAKAEACSHQATLPQNAAQRDRWLKLADEWTKLAIEGKKDRGRRVAVSPRLHVGRIASTGP
jgi:hypothetical protein